MKLIAYFSVICFYTPCSFAQILDTVCAVQVDTSDYRFETDIESYKSSENWTIWSIPMKNIRDTVERPELPTANYSNQVINDQNLNTAWVSEEISNEFTPKIEFEFHYFQGATYGSAYEFFGQINLFNGMCESLDTWTTHSRVKLIKVSYNDSAFCLVQLHDTWHFQYFNLDHYFQNKYSEKFLNAPFEIEEGDTLTFEIVDLYEGTKYAQGAVSEFMIEGAKN